MFTTLLPRDADIIKNIARNIIAYFTQPETTDGAILHFVHILNGFKEEYTSGVLARFNEVWWPRHVKKIAEAIDCLDKIKLNPDKTVASKEALKVLVTFLKQSKSKNWQPDSLNNRLIAQMLNNKVPDFQIALMQGGEHLCWQLEISLQQQASVSASETAPAPMLMMHQLWQLVVAELPFLADYTQDGEDRSAPRPGKV